MQTVLITYCWNRVGYNILRSLVDHGIRVFVADTSKRNICSMSKFVEGSYVYPDPFTQEAAFIDKLLTIVAEIKPQVLLPTHDEGIIIARNRARFPKELIIPIPDYDLLTTLSDKQKATDLAASVGVPVPKVYGNIDEVDHFPVVLKAAVSNSAKDVYFLETKEALEQKLKEYEGRKVLIEEKCPGCDYSVDCLRGNDFFQASVYRALVTKTEGGGTTTQRVIVDRPDLIAYAQRILDKVDYLAVCGMDFKVDDATGQVGFIEVNARYTGGLATPMAAGFDIPYLHFCLATGTTLPPRQEARIGTKTRWILGDFITFAGKLLSLHLKFNDCKQLVNFDFDAFDDFRKDDKRVIWGEMGYYLGKLLKNGKLNP